MGAGVIGAQYLPGSTLELVGLGENPEETVEETVTGTEEWVPSTCWIGKQDCGVLARKVDGRITKLEGHPAHPRSRGFLCPKGMAQIQAIYDPNRVKTPLRRTNGKGVSGEWQEISWDDALTALGDKIKEIAPENRARDLIWQKGRSKGGVFYDDSFVKASGATKLHHGGFCSDAAYRASEFTTGLHGVLHPDFRHTRFLLSFGWNAMNAGGNKLCQMTWHRQLLEAKENGLKMVQLDPSRRGAGPFADEWLPIRPATDTHFFLAVANVLIANGFVDAEYLKAHTNAPFLVKEDGHFLESSNMDADGKPKAVAWSDAAGRSFDVGTSGLEPALEGSFTVDGQTVKPAFELFKEHVADTTPEWAAEITGLDADQIRKIAVEMGEAASIGSTMVVDGIELPYRPVAMMAYHVSQQELGFQAFRAANLVSMLMGTIEAVGGQRSDFAWNVNGNFEALANIEVKDGPYNVDVGGNSKFFPINSSNSSIVAHAMMDPDKWELGGMPKVMIVHMANPVVAYPDQPVVRASYEKYEYIAVIDPWLSETADLYADLVLPAATIEKYEGPYGVTDQYEDAVTLRLPPMDPLFQSRGDIDIYLDLCEKAEILTGEDGYLDHINSGLGLTGGPHEIDINTKPAVREIFDLWSKSQGIDEGISFFEREGVKQLGSVPATAYYGYAADPPFSGIKQRFYGEPLLGIQEQMREKGVSETFWRSYVPYPPKYRATMDSSPAEYDLYLTSHKMIEYKQSRSTFIPILNELAPQQHLEINPVTAKALGIDDGDDINVESHNAISGETRTEKTKARYLATIRPDTVAMPHHYGFFANKINKDNGPSANTLFYSGEGYVSTDASQAFHVKVKVSKA